MEPLISCPAQFISTKGASAFHVSSSSIPGVTQALAAISEFESLEANYTKAGCILRTHQTLYSNLASVAYQNQEFNSVLQVVGVITFSMFPVVCLTLLDATTPYRSTPKKLAGHARRFLVEFIFGLFPALFCASKFYYYISTSMILLVSMRYWFLTRNGLTPKLGESETKAENAMNQIRPSYTSLFRTIVTSWVNTAIFAVDFLSFPRSWAKTDFYGLSIMDMGTTSTLWCTAITSKAARGVPFEPFNLRKTLGKAKWMVILGLTRFFALYYIGYQVPVGEYGKHWNFFMTLAVVTVFSDWLMPKAKNAMNAAILAFAVMIGFQVVAELWDLESYMLFAPRIGFFSANREGILGCVGHTASYLIAVGIGRAHYIISEKLDERNFTPKLKSALLLLFLYGIVAMLMLGTGLIEDSFCVKPCRKLSNLPWLLRASAYNCFAFGNCVALHMLIPPSRNQMTYKGISTYRFALFLVGNLLTGLMNITIQPLLQPAYIAFLYVTIYFATLNAIAYFLMVMPDKWKTSLPSLMQTKGQGCNNKSHVKEA